MLERTPLTARVAKRVLHTVLINASDKIAEQWVVMDALGLMQQLGAVPIPT
jgi:predicted ester cyclase